MTRDAEALRAWLATHDEACPNCRHVLRGVVAEVCPECGAALRLAVASPGVSIGPWALAVISFSLGLGFDGVVLILLGVAFGIHLAGNGLALSNAPEALLFISPLIVLGLACAAGLTWFFMQRMRWGLVERRAQWHVAITIFVIVGVAHALGGALMVVLSRIL